MGQHTVAYRATVTTKAAQTAGLRGHTAKTICSDQLQVPILKRTGTPVKPGPTAPVQLIAQGVAALA